MITEAILDFLHGLASALSSFLHDTAPAAPGFVTDLGTAVTAIFNAVPSAVRWFLPIEPAVVGALTLVGLLVALGLLRFARRVLSLFTGGGGNA